MGLNFINWLWVYLPPWFPPPSNQTLPAPFSTPTSPLFLSTRFPSLTLLLEERRRVGDVKALLDSCMKNAELTARVAGRNEHGLAGELGGGFFGSQRASAL
ncbi:hypothetical protein CONPUDRAFT_150568 [Coniophora puteana RWD-64-598 SS2]|uniref:Uncharacterized protein n=1 Tax=Coniophora puteana (strain RWD-64-598) TaxID=741705 RepID=A0A5M3N422_CONPW|nr:uncharacterized protein CONPUDRAFT_150568 [Coniophora puteana RWD-64-598 SS2]EIW85784.1 hypothetical protein CONPUDRAFT_150568 [Coniophora puteana RWD-64-598 SS2]